jgi:tetratricopeptide (TPR) repeat protein
MTSDVQVLVERARLLMEQNRHGMAQDLLIQTLALDPDHARAHTWLALCVCQNRDRLKEATAEAERGVHLAPDDPIAHYVLAVVWQKRNEIAKALASIHEAIALYPVDADFHGIRSQLLGQQEKWQEALDAASEGLQFDPDNELCTTIRTLALERVGRVIDAKFQAEESLRQNPDSTWAHSSHGWAMLQQGHFKEAQQSFAEALRLDPSNELARGGMIQSLNSSNFVYRWMHLLLIRISRLGTRNVWILMIGLWIGMRLLNSYAKAHPEFAPWIQPILLCYLFLVTMSWLMVPLFNTMLRFHSFGKYLLSNSEKWSSNLIAAALGLAVLIGTVSSVMYGEWFLLFVAFLSGVWLSIAIVVPFQCDAKWARLIGIIVAGLFTLSFLLITVPMLFGLIIPDLFFAYAIGIMIYGFAGQALILAPAKR